MGRAKDMLLELDARLFVGSGDFVCADHVHELYLRSKLPPQALEDPCPACGEDGPVLGIPLDDLMDMIVATIRQYWERAVDGLYHDPEAPYGYAGPGVLDTADVLGDCLPGDVDEDLFVLIGERLTDELWYSPGDIWLEGSELLTSSWTGFAEWIRESDPEFAAIADEPVREFHSEVADGIPPAQMLPRLFEILDSERLVVVSVAADRWCRATHLAPGESATTKRLGSAPAGIGKANRMTRAGEVAFYASITEATALAEIRLTPPGYSTATAWWQPSRPLTLLDLTRIPAKPSFFDVSRAMQRAALSFIHEFAKAVSQPVTASSDDPIEYRATQAVCWYLQKHRPDVDGIVYASSLTGERSCALWIDNDQCLDESDPPASELTLRRSPGPSRIVV